MVKLNNNFYREEIRCDYLVTEKQKKIWGTELEIFSVFDSICKKYELPYFVDYGTLLGAVRHQGFIPWDDDLDITMFRPDYERLKTIIRDELPQPYFFQDAYSDSILFTFSKIRDGRTSAIERKYCQNASPNQGIFIDIFPLDGGFLPGTTKIELIEKELWACVTKPDLIQKIIDTPEYPSTLTRDILQELISMPIKDRLRQFEAFVAGQFDIAEELGLITTILFSPKWRVKKSWYNEIVYLPFEHLMVPAPANYDQVLTARYGDYHKFVQGGGAHRDIIMDPDKSYLEYYKEWGII